MKILFVGNHNPHFIALPEYIEHAIVLLGHKLCIFDDRKCLIPETISTRLPFLRNWELRKINSNLLAKVKSFKPDICLINSLYRIKPEIIRQIKDQGIKTGFIITDFPWEPQKITAEAINYDFVFYGGTEVEEILETAKFKNSHWSPFACDEKVHKPVCLTEKEYQEYSSDIAFVGTVSAEIYPQRVELLEKISDLNLKVWGPGTNEILKTSPLKKNIHGQHVRPAEWLKIYAATKIGLCIHFKDPKRQKPCYQASPRVFELLACKCFVLVDEQADVRKIFKDGKHLVVFKDLNDLRNKIDYYLVHDQERKEIAESGFQEVISKHTYVHRLKEIFSIMQGK
ncbi:MAG: glycosyltransferase [Candidatus Omnitrophota bacterium]